MLLLLLLDDDTERVPRALRLCERLVVTAVSTGAASLLLDIRVHMDENDKRGTNGMKEVC